MHLHMQLCKCITILSLDMSNFLIPRPNILKFCTFEIGILVKKSVKFGKRPFFISREINFAGPKNQYS